MMFTSRQAPPNFVGLTPARTALGRFAHRQMRAVMERISLSDGMPIFRRAFIRYFGVGMDLRTEAPTPAEIRKAVDRLLQDRQIRSNVARLADEFNRYEPNAVIASALLDCEKSAASAGRSRLTTSGG